MRDQKGIALIITMWTLVMLTVVAMSFTFSSRRGNASTRNFKEDTRAYYLAVSAYEEAISYLLSDPDRAVDFVDGDGNFRTDRDRAPIAGRQYFGNAEITIRITDEESKININSLTRDTANSLLAHIGVPEDKRAELIDTLADWIDPNDLHHLLGAEDEYYEAFGYKAKNRPLELPEELLLVKGYGPGLLYGGDDNQPMMPLITTTGAGININTATPGLLYMLGLNKDTVDGILTKRAEEGGIRRVPAIMKKIARTASSNFRVQVSARMNDNPMAVRITSLVHRDFKPGGAEMRTIYWKEDIENSGS